MAAWQPGVRVGGKREEERESEIDRERERRREEAGRRQGEGYHNITNHRRRDVSIQSLTLARVPALLVLISPSRLHPPRGDSRTRYLSSPRAIRTNGRIRQLSRYIPQPLASLSRVLLTLFRLFHRRCRYRRPPPALSPPRRSPSAILPLVALPRSSLSPSISVGSPLFSVDTIP